MSSKIKRVLRSWPQSGVATMRWLKNEGVDNRLADKYVRSGWLERLGHGAYTRVGYPVDWAGGISAIQNQLGIDIHPGGITAMDIRGHSHYLALGGRDVILFIRPRVTVPSWFLRHQWSQRIKLITSSAFDNLEECTSLVNIDSVTIAASTLELAAFEMMLLVPRQQSFDEALQIMETLTTIRPKVVQQILENCTSVKAKRLFMHAAEQVDHLWLSDLDLSKVNFGSGRRSIHVGGRLDHKYNIVIDSPLEFYG